VNLVPSLPPPDDVVPVPGLALLHVREGESDESACFGPYRIDSLISRADQGALTAYRVRIEPGQTTMVSYHLASEELYYVLRGSGTALLDGRAHALRAGDFLRLPPGTTHGFITEFEALEMLDIHTPGSRPDQDVYFVGEVPPGFATLPVPLS
jgi:mannose-6-phosphate isomerase-like protein (cupin superfamily)